MYGSAASIIIELVVIGLLVIGIVTGVKKGFFKSLMDLLILGAAVFCAVMVCRWTTDYLVERFYPKAEENMLKALEKADLNLSDVDLEAMKFDEDHPDTLTDQEYLLLQENNGIRQFANTLNKAGISENRTRAILAKTLKKASVSSSSLNEALTDSAKAATRKGLTVAVQVVVFIVVLLIVSILLQILTNSIRRLLWKVDMIKTLDRFLGFLAGALVMFVIIFVVLYVFRRLDVVSVEEKIGETLFTQFLNINNPINLFFE